MRQMDMRLPPTTMLNQSKQPHKMGVKIYQHDNFKKRGCKHVHEQIQWTARTQNVAANMIISANHNLNYIQKSFNTVKMRSHKIFNRNEDAPWLEIEQSNNDITTVIVIFSKNRWERVRE